MTCQEFWNASGSPGLDATEDQAAHLTECSVCAAEWEKHRALAARVQSMREDWHQMEAPQRVEVGLTAAFRAHAGFPARRSVVSGLWKPALTWASAAAASIGLAIVLIHGLHPAAKRDDVASPRHSAQSVPEVAALQQDSDADDYASVLGDGFVRLPNAPSIGPNEPFDVVQLAVPGSAVIAWGLPVSEERASETLLADVALASDGTMRAVRLVSDGGTF